MSEVEAPQVRKDRRLFLLRILALLFVVALTVLLFVYRDEIQKFKAYGYPGIFLLTMLANATVLIPAPGVAFVFAMGNILNPWLVGLAASAGGALGESTGYLAGFSGQAVIERMDVYRRVQPFVEKYGGFAIFVLAAIPNPFFDLAGIAAGCLKMSIGRFFLFCWLGQLVKMTCFAMAGFYSLNWLLGR